MSSPAITIGPAVASGLYDAAAYDWSRAPITYWHATGGAPPVQVDPLAGDVDVEVAIVGGGITGLSTALHLARDHGVTARVLEAGPLGWGASGRNGGFCCMGGARRSLGGLIRRFGDGQARIWFEAQKQAVELVRSLAMRHRIELQTAGEGEWVVAHTPRHVDLLARDRDEILTLTGEDWPLLGREELVERGITLEEAFAGLLIPHAFGLHPLRYLRGLARAATEHGARIHERSPVVAWTREGRHHRLITPTGSIWAERVLFATNAYAPEWLAPQLEGRTLPVLSAILVTRPLTLSEREAQGWRGPALVSDTRDLLFYMRLLPDGRFLFGARGGLRADQAAFQTRRAWLEARFRARFPAWSHATVEHAWWGLAALAYDRLPHLSPVPGVAGAWVAGCYHGNGVALATLFGRAAAARLAGREPDVTLPAFVQRPMPRFPMPRLRLAWLRAAYGWYRLQERLDELRFSTVNY